MRDHTDPQQIPDDADARDLAAYVGEDIGRVIMLRVAALTAVVAIIAGLMSESASEALKGACIGAGTVGVVLLLGVQLFGVRRTRQWAVILLVTLACAGLLAAVFAGSRS